VGDDHRVRPPPPQEQRTEDDAHDRVADEGAESLIQVVRAAECGFDRYRAGRAEPDQPEPAQQVPDDQDLLEQAVLQGGQQQHRDAPPYVRQVRRDDVQRDAGPEREVVQPEATAADHRGEPRAAKQVAPRLREVHADGRRALAVPDQQVEHEHHRREAVGDAD
jgi:hypothetical protein